MPVRVKAYAVLVKETNTILSTKMGVPRLWRSMRGPAQFVGAGKVQNDKYQVVVVRIEVIQ